MNRRRKKTKPTAVERSTRYFLVPESDLGSVLGQPGIQTTHPLVFDLKDQPVALVKVNSLYVLSLPEPVDNGVAIDKAKHEVLRHLEGEVKKPTKDRLASSDLGLVVAISIDEKNNPTKKDEPTKDDVLAETLAVADALEVL